MPTLMQLQRVAAYYGNAAVGNANDFANFVLSYFNVCKNQNWGDNVDNYNAAINADHTLFGSQLGDNAVLGDAAHLYFNKSVIPNRRLEIFYFPVGDSLARNLNSSFRFLKVRGGPTYFVANYHYPIRIIGGNISVPVCIDGQYAGFAFWDNNVQCGGTDGAPPNGNMPLFYAHDWRNAILGIKKVQNDYFLGSWNNNIRSVVNYDNHLMIRLNQVQVDATGIMYANSNFFGCKRIYN